MRTTIPTLSLLFLILSSLPLEAHKRHFTFSCDWFTPFKNERELAPKAEWEWGYTLGTSRQIHRHFWLGAEAFGRLDEKEHGAGPAFVYDFAPGTRIVATYVVPIEGEVPRFRMIFAYEF